MWNFTNDKEASFDLIPNGVYQVIVDKAEEGTTKAGDPKLSMTFVITDGEYQGRKVFSNFNLGGNEKAVQIARGQLKSLLKCAGKSLDIKGPHEFYGCEVLASIKIKKDDAYGDKNIVSFFKPLPTDKKEVTGTPF